MVDLFHKANPEKQIKVYALLDDASDTTFVTTQVKEKLGIEGVQTSLNLSTMLGREVLEVLCPMLGCVSIVPASLFSLLLSQVPQIPRGRIALRISLILIFWRFCPCCWFS